VSLPSNYNLLLPYFKVKKKKVEVCSIDRNKSLIKSKVKGQEEKNIKGFNKAIRV
jgi:hypothetical protein